MKIKIKFNGINWINKLNKLKKDFQTTKSKRILLRLGFQIIKKELLNDIIDFYSH
jgi:hypothetical protein